MFKVVDMSNEFLDLMSGVQPLKKTECVELKKRTLDVETAAARRRAAQISSPLSLPSTSHNLLDSDSLVSDLSDDRLTIKPVAPSDVLSFSAPRCAAWRF